MNVRSLAVVVGLGMFVSGAVAEPPATRPNVVVILVDDLGWTDLGCYGSEFYETPNIDALADAGLRFTDGYASHPVCSPTRAAIMTGKNPCRESVNITDWIPGEQRQHEKLLPPKLNNNLPLSETTIAETLQKAGYATWHLGKWHLGETAASWPKAHGFDVNVGGYHRGQPDAYYTPYGNPNLTDGPPGEYLTDRLTSEAIKLIETRDAEKPFFMYLPFYTVHTPIQACQRHLPHFKEKKAKLGLDKPMPEKTEGRGKTHMQQDNAAYASMVFAMDENVGRLLDALKEQKLDENTLIVFLGDNGGLSTTKWGNCPTSLLPLRAGKGWGYEGGTRVPFIVSDPLIRKGAVSHEPAVATDLYATILDRCGLPPMPEQAADSTSLLPLFTRSSARLKRSQPLVWHYPHYHCSGWTPGSTIRVGDWKLVSFYDPPRVELYNLKKDIGEQNNLAEKESRRTRKLKRQLDDYLKATGASMPTPNPNAK